MRILIHKSKHCSYAIGRLWVDDSCLTKICALILAGYLVVLNPKDNLLTAIILTYSFILTSLNPMYRFFFQLFLIDQSSTEARNENIPGVKKSSEYASSNNQLIPVLIKRPLLEPVSLLLMTSHYYFTPSQFKDMRLSMHLGNSELVDKIKNSISMLTSTSFLAH